MTTVICFNDQIIPCTQLHGHININILCVAYTLYILYTIESDQAMRNYKLRKSINVINANLFEALWVSRINDRMISMG